MNIDKLTLKVQQSINDAQAIAVKYNHQQIDGIHLFMALLSQDDGLVPNIFSKMGVNIRGLRDDTERALDSMPKVTGNGAENSGVYATRRFEQIFIKAEEIADKFKDSYVSVEHIMLALMNVCEDSEVGKLLAKYNINKNNFMKVLSEVRGN